MKRVLVEITIAEGLWDPTWDDGDQDEAMRHAVQNYLENCPEWPPYFASIRPISRVINMYKIVFIGTEMEYDHIVIGGASAEDREATQKTVPKHPVKSVYQTHLLEESGELAIKAIKEIAKKRGIEIDDFTEVSLMFSTQTIGALMREKL